MAESKYKWEERLRIGKEIYVQKLTKYTAAAKYGISPYTARDYLRMYKAQLQINDFELKTEEQR